MSVSRATTPKKRLKKIKKRIEHSRKNVKQNRIKGIEKFETKNRAKKLKWSQNMRRDSEKEENSLVNGMKEKVLLRLVVKVNLQHP